MSSNYFHVFPNYLEMWVLGCWFVPTRILTQSTLCTCLGLRLVSRALPTPMSSHASDLVRSLSGGLVEWPTLDFHHWFFRAQMFMRHVAPLRADKWQHTESSCFPRESMNFHLNLLHIKFRGRGNSGLACSQPCSRGCLLPGCMFPAVCSECLPVPASSPAIVWHAHMPCYYGGRICPHGSLAEARCVLTPLGRQAVSLSGSETWFR